MSDIEIVLVQSQKSKHSGKGREFVILDASDGPLFELAKQVNAAGKAGLTPGMDTCARCRAKRSGGFYCPNCGSGEVLT